MCTQVQSAKATMQKFRFAKNEEPSEGKANIEKKMRESMADPFHFLLFDIDDSNRAF
jgi:hypothetical protein